MIFANLPKEIRHRYLQGSIMEILKPLYGISKAGTHWFSTYYTHYIKNLYIVILSFDPCLLIIFIGKDIFGIIGIQTDNIFILALASFSQLEDVKLDKAKLCAKPKEKLTLESPLIFNRGILTKDKGAI